MYFGRGRLEPMGLRLGHNPTAIVLLSVYYYI